MFFYVIKKNTILFILTMVIGVVIILSVSNSRLVTNFTERGQEQTLVIDAGHGGFDGGAVGISGTSEQDINLSIAQKTESLAGFFGIPTVMTRSDNQSLDYNAGSTIRQNKVADIKAREAIVNSIKNPVLISIHLNKFEDSQYSGAQVFYSRNHENSAVLAKLLQTNLRNGLNSENDRKEKAASNAIYLMKKLDCPAVIVECGFLSNLQEEKLLGQDDYHKRIAVCIVNGFLSYEQEENQKENV